MHGNGRDAARVELLRFGILPNLSVKSEQLGGIVSDPLSLNRNVKASGIILGQITVWMELTLLWSTSIEIEVVRSAYPSLNNELVSFSDIGCFFNWHFLVFHTLLVLFEATTINCAFNSHNKVLLTVMMANNFVEIKGTVFKKYDKNNLFQVRTLWTLLEFFLS